MRKEATRTTYSTRAEKKKAILVFFFLLKFVRDPFVSIKCVSADQLVAVVVADAAVSRSLDFSVAAAPPSRGVLSLMGRNPGDGWRSTDEKSANKQKHNPFFSIFERVGSARSGRSPASAPPSACERREKKGQFTWETE